MPRGHTPFRIAAGALVGGKYRLVRLLGEGGMGVVWSAVNETTGGQVALKLLVRPEVELRARMLREARAVCAIRHRNVLQVHDVGQTDAGDPFLVMELLTGETLADMLARKRRLPPGEAAALGRDVARALSAAHERGILHRDLKPANIFLHEEPGGDGPMVKVVDFGVSKSLLASDDVRTAAGAALGSPSYMSPEQMQADPTVDGRTDIWSLGVVLFEMLTGERPFRGEPMELVRQVLTEPVPRAARRLRRLDPRLDELVASCLRRPREERPWPASELAAKLGELAWGEGAGEPVERVGPGDEGEDGDATVPLELGRVGMLPRSRPSAPAGAVGDRQSGPGVAAGDRQPVPGVAAEDRLSAPGGAAGDRVSGPGIAAGDRQSAPGGAGGLPATPAAPVTPLPGAPAVQNAGSTTMPFAISQPEPRGALASDGRDPADGDADAGRRRPGRMPWVLGGVTVAMLALAGVLVVVWPGAPAAPEEGGAATASPAAAEPALTATAAAPSSPATTAPLASAPAAATPTATATGASASFAQAASSVPATPAAASGAGSNPPPPGSAPGSSPGAAGATARTSPTSPTKKTSKPAGAVCPCDKSPKPACCKSYEPSGL